MCGIAGLINFGFPPQSDKGIILVRDMLDKIINRGPDQSSILRLENIILGANRLKIVGGSRGNQPITHKKYSTSLAFNGEIYNYADLTPSINKNFTDGDLSDTEILLNLLTETGIDCINKLNGMFAFCFTDGIQTYLVRDRLGIKPLYYCAAHNSILFASEAKSLITNQTELNLEKSYNEFETNIENETMMRGVFEVPSGCYLYINSKTLTKKLVKYYSLPVGISTNLNKTDAVEELRYLVNDAVRIRTQTNLNYGCYTSGGIDSAIISCLSKPSINLCSIVTDQNYMIEEQYAKILEKEQKTKFQYVVPSTREFIDYLVEMVYALDFPTTTLAAFSQFLLSKAAKNLGLRIVLSGIGADEFFMGYARHAFLLLEDPKAYLKSGNANYEPLSRRIINKQFPNSAEKYFALLNRSEAKSRYGLKRIESIFLHNPNLSSAISAADSIVTLPPLLRTDDRINMHFGIESRSPFLDYRVIEFALKLPTEYKLRYKDGAVTTKYLLREAFRNLIPAQIVARQDKIGFPSPVSIWLDQKLEYVYRNAFFILKTTNKYEKLEKTLSTIKQQESFSRKRWNVVQWAAWHLLFVEKFSIEKSSELLFQRDS